MNYSRQDLTKFFKATTALMVETMEAKNADYSGASADDPFFNFTRVEALEIASAEQGFLTRMTDKFTRIISITKKGSAKVKDETIIDTLVDLANYSLLLAAYLESKKIVVSGVALEFGKDSQGDVITHDSLRCRSMSLPLNLPVGLPPKKRKR